MFHICVLFTYHLLIINFQKHSRWDVNLDISAPQIMVPENFSDQTSNMMVLDLGHVHFYNKTIDAPGKKQTDDDDNDGEL